jgi:UDP-3-O-[3-hydroxymyristoyl] N-acetylglucosamine deacetylase/3-hydroxyacyl-[acyl-carrier-protein] dehydratase
MAKQRTIKKEITLKGVGIHTGQEVIMTLKPAPENHGIAFVRTDLEGNPIIEAKASYVVNTERGTNLEKKGVFIRTGEHVLAAAVGMDLDNLIIELNAEEPPIMDGSSAAFVEAIEKAGVVEQNAEREEYIVRENITYKDAETGSEIVIMPAEEYQITTLVDFGTKILGTQNATLEHLSDFKEQISKARTFSFLHELEAMLDHGLIKGGDINNAIVYVDKEISTETLEKLKKAFNRPNISVKPQRHT